MKSNRFETYLYQGLYLLIPEEIALIFLEKNQKRVLVKLFFENNHTEFHAALRKIKGHYLIMCGKRHQKLLGMYPTDDVKVELYEDDTKYGVEMSEEFEAVFMSDYEAFQFFEKLTDGKKRSLIYYISRFKNSQTRIDKTLIIAENLKLGIKDQKLLVKNHTSI